MGWFSDDEDDEDEKSYGRSSPGEERKDQINSILDDYQIDEFTDPEKKDFKRVESREYQEYMQTEEKHGERNWYLKLVDTLGFYDMDLGETAEKINEARSLLLWDLDTERIFSAALVVATLTLIGVMGIFVVNFMFGLSIPTLFLVGSLFIPLIVLYYLIQYPVLQVQRKVINASDELILMLLYMVIYMRNSPNIEGAVRFAALNTEGAVSEDLKHVLWATEVGNYTTVQEALTDYA